jgi:tetratricopeptide (TPR) repeat protein
MPALSPDQWRALSPYLDQALEIPPEKRSAWLELLREKNPVLATELQTLLNEHDALGEEAFLKTGAARPSPVPLIGQAIGAYTLESPIGQGGMGTVWLARRSDGRFEGRAAVKFLNVAFLGGTGEERFKREGTILARLAHPNIAHLIDAGVSPQGQPYLILEYVEGKNIDAYCREQALDIEARIRLFLDVLAAVAHAHANLIVHRDIKPSNVLVTSDGHVKLLDFGIAKLLEDEAAASSVVLTRQGERALTLAFAAPEQVTGSAVTTGTDVYALGILLYLLLAGKHPAESTLSSPADLMRAIVDTQPPRPSEALGPATKLSRAVRGDLDTIVAKALKKNPQERYVSASAFADDLRRYLGHQTISARPDTLAYRARKFVRRHRVPVAAAALLMVSLSTALFLVNRERGIAQQRFMEVRQLAAKLLDIDGEVVRLPGSTKTRQLIVDTSLEYLRRLSADVRGDRELALEIGNAYLRVARVQGVPNSPNLGQIDQADVNLRIAEGFIHSVLASHPANRTAMLRAAEIAHDRMFLARVRVRHQEALAFARKSAELLEKFRPEKSDKSEEWAVLNTYVNVAQQHMFEQQFDDALRLCGRTVEIARSFDNQTYIANAFSLSAEIFRRRGDLDRALKDIHESLRLLEPKPEDTGQGRALSFVMALIYQGRILGWDNEISMGRFEEAVTTYERAFSIADGFVHQDPNDQGSRGKLAMAGIELAGVLRHSKRSSALAVYDHTLQHLAEIKNNPSFRRYEVIALAGSSYPLGALGRFAEARQRLDGAFERLRQLKMYPAEKINLGLEADWALSALAAHEASTGNVVRALEIYQELLDKVDATGPKPESILQDAVPLSRIYAAKAALHQRAGQAELASTLDARRIDLWRHWERQLPNNPFVLRQLGARPDQDIGQADSLKR